MKSIKILTNSFLILLLVAGFFACSKKSDNPVAPTAPTTELKLTVGGEQFTFSEGTGGYAIQEDLTYAQFTTRDAADTLIFLLLYGGKQSGNQNWDSAQNRGALLYQTGSSGTIILSSSTGSTNITSYGNVGSSITGSFSGVLIDDNNSQVNTSGTFSVIRTSDINTIGKPSFDINKIIQSVKF